MVLSDKWEMRLRRSRISCATRSCISSSTYCTQPLTQTRVTHTSKAAFHTLHSYTLHSHTAPYTALTHVKGSTHCTHTHKQSPASRRHILHQHSNNYVHLAIISSSSRHTAHTHSVTCMESHTFTRTQSKGSHTVTGIQSHNILLHTVRMHSNTVTSGISACAKGVVCVCKTERCVCERERCVCKR